MKTLLLMRHAKSSWKDSNLKDFERPINKRGKKDAPFMGKLIKGEELVPQKIISSPAVRARETLEAFIEVSNFKGEVVFDDSYYMGEPESYLKPLLELPDDIERVMVVGHNPGLEGLLQHLSGRVDSLPTAAIAHIVLPIHSWKEIDDEADADLIQLWLPRELRKKDKKKAKSKKK